VSDTHHDHWSDYWQQGRLTSLPQGFAANYDGEFQQFWDAHFARLSPGSRVLDVCSGNGSIALLAQAYSDRAGAALAVTAADAASLSTETIIAAYPQFEAQVRAIAWLPDTRLETLEPPAASFDLITSQYGFEYTDWAASAARVASALRPGGRFAMVCHSMDSTIAREMAAQQADYARILETPLFAAEPAPDPDAEGRAAFARELEDTLATLYTQFQRNRASRILAAAGGRLEEINRQVGTAFTAGYQAFAEFRRALRTSHDIAADLLSVYRAIEASPQWHEALSAAGLHLLETGQIHYHTGEVAGASYLFEKPTGEPHA
jgi:SAM-dependent methyltransferase